MPSGVSFDGKASGIRIGMRVTTVSGSTTSSTTKYFVLDHLGSTAVIMSADGTVSERLAYDAWGKRRNTDGTDDDEGTIRSATNRGFTSHEHIDDVGLINMNARIYDPSLGRFLAADPLNWLSWQSGATDDQDKFSQYIVNPQNLNQYTYVRNNPLNSTDPSGMVCNKDGTLCYSDVIPRKITTKNVQNTAAMDKSMQESASQVRVGRNASHENIGFIEKDGSFRNPSDAKTGSTSTQDNASATVRPDDIAVLHSHIPGRDAGMQDNTEHGRQLGDAQPLKFGLPNGTVMGKRLGVHELVGGAVQFRMIDGKMTPREQRDIQKNLNEQQKLLDEDPR